MKGYISKEQATGQIVTAIRHVLSGKTYLSPAMTEKLLAQAAGRAAATSPTEALANRELEVFCLIGQGVKTADIAAKLHLSPKTIETYRDRLRRKLGLRDSNELLQFATRWELENR